MNFTNRHFSFFSSQDTGEAVCALSEEQAREKLAMETGVKVEDIVVNQGIVTRTMMHRFESCYYTVLPILFEVAYIIKLSVS